MVFELVTLGAFIGLVTATLVYVVVHMVKNGKDTGAVTEVKDGVTEVLTKEEIEEGLRNWRGKDLELAPGVEAHLDMDCDFINIEVHGKEYDSLEEALEKSKKLDAATRELMETAIEEARVLRQALLDESRRYSMIDSEFDGDIYVYEPCKIKIDTASRLAALKPSRLAIEIVRHSDGKMYIGKVFSAKEDVTSKNRYVFDMTDDAQADSFTMLIGANKKYAEEMEQIAKIEERLEDYNTIVEQKRIERRGKEIMIKPPTKEQYEARQQVLKNRGHVVITFSPKAEEKEAEFVSSQDAI